MSNFYAWFESVDFTRTIPLHGTHSAGATVGEGGVKSIMGHDPGMFISFEGNLSAIFVPWSSVAYAVNQKDD